MHVLIVGAGLGGLACAVSCRAAGLKTTILEQSPEITEVRLQPLPLQRQ